MVEFVDVEEFEDQMGDELDHVWKEYRAFRDDEGIPVHTGLYVEDINTLETGPWERTGQKGAFVNLYGAEGVNDMQIHEIAPGEETTEQQHFYDALVYVTQGQGLVAVGPEGDETVVEFQEQSHFALPQNVPYRYVNTSDETPLRLVSQSGLPQLCNMVKDTDFFFDCDYEFWNASDDGDIYSTESTLREGETFPVVWDANFIPDIQKFEKLETWHHRGAGGVSVRLPMPASTMYTHISEFPVGTYKKAHRHGPGANVGILSGEGYSLMWKEGMDQLVKVDWKPGSIITPPARWYHQHFNTGEEPARYFAMHIPRLGDFYSTDMFDPHLPVNQIEYAEEDPDIRELFEEELAENGLEMHMPEAAYTDPDFEFSG